MTITDYFNLYAESHQNPMNIKIHTICVPLIMWSILALLDIILLPIGTLGLLLTVLSSVFYFKIKTPFIEIIKIFILSIFMIYSSRFLQDKRIIVSVVVFVLAWIGQFIGHKIEGKKPSFFDDLKFLLIGPLWVLKKFS